MHKFFYISSKKVDIPLTISINRGSISIPVDPSETYDYDIDMGDGTVLTNQTGGINYTYGGSARYDIKITGQFPKFYYNDGAGRQHIEEIKHWGTNHQWSTNQRGAFWGCSNLIITAPTPPNMIPTNIREMFWDCTSLTDNNNTLAGIDTSNLIDARNAFDTTPLFNGDLSNWNITPNFTSAQGMFAGSGINFSLGGWDVREMSGTNFMLSGSGLSEANYNATLIGWANLPSLRAGSLFRADGLIYSGAGKVARQFIIDNYGWDFQNDIDGDV